MSAGDGDDYLPGGDRPGVRDDTARRPPRSTPATCWRRSRSRVSASSSSTRSTPTGSSSCPSPPESPVHAADTSVLVRNTIRAVGVRHGLRTSFSPKVDAAGVGNGGHVHLSLGRDERNLMAGGSGRFGLTDEATAFAGGILDAPAGAAGARRALGGVVPPARAAALGRRLRVLGPGEPRGRAADGHRLARERGLGGQPRGQVLRPARQPLPDAGRPPGRRHRRARPRRALPEPVDVDPGVPRRRGLARRGCPRLPTSLREAPDAFVADRCSARRSAGR